MKRTADTAAAPRKKRRLIHIAVLPSFITLMNGACGFFAIIIASRVPAARWSLPLLPRSSMSSFALAGYVLFLAMIADMLDGRVARLTRSTSSFGGQLDSLSDAVSFGIAPAFLMIKLVEYTLALPHFEQLHFSMFLRRGIIFSAVLYAMCALVRLARFNVENEEDEAAHMYFVGLPSPAAAGVVVSLVIFHQQILPRITVGAADTINAFDVMAVIIIPAVTLLAGILMVSRIRYPHVANHLFRRKKTLPVFLAIFAGGLLIVWNLQLAMAAGFCGFALYGFIRWIMVSLFRKKPPRQELSA